MFRFFSNFFDLHFIFAVKWSFLGQIFSRLTNLISTILLARIMLPSTYGKYIYLVGTIIFFSQVFSLSARSTSIRNISYYFSEKIKLRRYIFITILNSVFFSVSGLILLSSILIFNSTNLISVEYSNTILFPFLLILVFEIMYLTLLGIMEGFQLFKDINIITIFASLLKFVIPYFMFLSFGLEGAFFGYLISSGLIFVTTSLYSYKILKQKNISLLGLKYFDCKEEIKLFFKFSVPSFFQAITLLLLVWIIQTIILSDANVGKSELALYNVANQWKGFMVYLPAILINATQSFFSKYVGLGENEKTNTLFIKSRKLVIWFSLIIGLFFYFFSEKIISLFGSGYQSADILLILFIIPSIFVSLNNLNRHLLFSKGFVWELAILNFISCTLSLLIFQYLKHYYSLSMSFVLAIGVGEMMLFIFYDILRRRSNK